MEPSRRVGFRQQLVPGAQTIFVIRTESLWFSWSWVQFPLFWFYSQSAPPWQHQAQILLSSPGRHRNFPPVISAKLQDWRSLVRFGLCAHSYSSHYGWGHIVLRNQVWPWVHSWNQGLVHTSDSHKSLRNKEPWLDEEQHVLWVGTTAVGQ